MKRKGEEGRKKKTKEIYERVGLAQDAEKEKDRILQRD